MQSLKILLFCVFKLFPVLVSVLSYASPTSLCFSQPFKVSFGLSSPPLTSCVLLSPLISISILYLLLDFLSFWSSHTTGMKTVFIFFVSSLCYILSRCSCFSLTTSVDFSLVSAVRACCLCSCVSIISYLIGAFISGEDILFFIKASLYNTLQRKKISFNVPQMLCGLIVIFFLLIICN